MAARTAPHGSTATRLPPVLAHWRRLQGWPGGGWLFSRLVCRRAPYFGSIAPRIRVLEPGRCEAQIAHRRRVTNHLGTVHAIALCNLAELAAGLMTDVSIPGSMRWIPKAMSVQYLRKAVGRMTATATPAFAPHDSDAGYELPVAVSVRDPAGEAVFEASIRMWVSPRR
jgi:acyl-coenzyme A thioesterase PaaI-like protein